MGIRIIGHKDTKIYCIKNDIQLQINIPIEITHFYNQAGADPLKANDYGKTPLDYAQEPIIKRALTLYGEKHLDKVRKQEQDQGKSH